MTPFKSRSIDFAKISLIIIASSRNIKLTQYKAIDDFRESLYKYIYAFFHSVSEGALNDYFDTAIMLYTINDYTNVNKDYNGRFDDLLSKLTKREIENIEENISKKKLLTI